MRKAAFSFLILVFLPVLLNAASRGDSLILPAYQWNVLGDKIRPVNPDSAISCYTKAALFYKEADSLGKWLRMQYNIASCLAFSLDKPYDALSRIDESIEQMKEWRTPLGEHENEQYCSLYLIRGHIHKQKTGDFISVKKSLEKAYQIFRDSLSKTPNARAEYLFFQLGNNNVRLLEFQSAQVIFEKGIEYSKRFNVPKVAKYADYASLFIAKREYENALIVIQEGLNYSGISQEDSIFLLLAKGECYCHLSRWEESLSINALVGQMLKQPLEKPNKRPEYEIGLYENYGMIALGQKDYTQSLLWYNKALTLAQSYPNSPTRNIAFLHVEIGEILQEDKKILAALESYQAALHTLLNSFSSPSYENPPDSILFAENILYKALEGKARCFESIGNLSKALECYELIPTIETKLRVTHLYESSSLATIENSRSRFDKAIHIAWNLYEKTKEIQYAERALVLSEEARGMLLLKSMVQSQMTATIKLPDSLREHDNEIRVQLSEYEHQIAELNGSKEEADIVRLNDLIRRRHELKQDQETFLDQISSIFPGYAQISENLLSLKKDKIPSLLRSNQAFIDFFLTENTAFIFFIEPNGNLIWRKQSLPAHFRDSFIQPFIEYLAQGADKSIPETRHRWFKQTSFELYELLLAPVLSATRQKFDALIIVPDDVLAFLPFEILLQKQSQAAWPDLPYLLRQYSISYAYSATVLGRQQANMREHNTANRIPFAGFAPKYSDTDRDPQTGEELYPITGMKAMVENVKDLLGGEVFEDSAANEPAFIKTAPRCRVLLLAMHGFVHEQEPTLSRLLFGNPQKSGSPDNVLYTNELQITYLPADLVVLNACYSGFGKLHRGEGVYSVTRALTSAGVPATLMSIWKLHGASSPVLIEVFFKNLTNGMPKDVALQKAKIELLTNPDYDPVVHPFYWGGLLATGDMSVLKF